MLAQTFQHLRGIGPKKESALWRCGIFSWDDFESSQLLQSSLFGNGFKDPIREALDSSRKALLEGWVEFFAERLSREEHYRIALSFPAKTLFLDIETTGLSTYYDQITLVGWSEGSRYNAYISGTDDSALRHAMESAGIIVTFNGSLFDLPFLRQNFEGLRIPPVHVDLRFLGRRVGLSGGQKSIEEQLGIKRPKELADMRGEAAPLLWHRYRRGDVEALRLLLAYNHADIEGMKQILDVVVKRLVRKQKPPVRGGVHVFSKERSPLRIGTSSLTGSKVTITPYCGKLGPALAFHELGLTREERRGLRIVGIDPTGSESKPSGWSLLEGNRATTRRIETDEDLIRATLDARPHLVSIDSPLSLPKGRLSIGDDDPMREQYGITRECERTLKKRGVNVYPCLIKSMQGLTSRGIRLTETLRKHGIPVIESYPGAAQDILGIPRKRAGLEFLATGLSEFGLIGEFQRGEVSHDELDAITSALVGLLFWSGRYEGLGNEEEGYLIIPDLKVDFRSKRGRLVIGLSGPIGAGKTTAGQFLEGMGFHYARFSLVLAEILRERGIEPTRETLQKLGDEIKSGSKQRWLGAKLLQTLPASGDIVVDGLRHPEDHALLLENFGSSFRHLYIDVPVETILERNAASGGNVEDLRSALSHRVESNVPVLASLAHERIVNTGNLDEFFAQLSAFITREAERSRNSAACQ